MCICFAHIPAPHCLCHTHWPLFYLTFHLIAFAGAILYIHSACTPHTFSLLPQCPPFTCLTSPATPHISHLPPWCRFPYTGYLADTALPHCLRSALHSCLHMLHTFLCIAASPPYGLVLLLFPFCCCYLPHIFYRLSILHFAFFLPALPPPTLLCRAPAPASLRVLTRALSCPPTSTSCPSSGSRVYTPRRTRGYRFVHLHSAIYLRTYYCPLHFHHTRFFFGFATLLPRVACCRFICFTRMPPHGFLCVSPRPTPRSRSAVGYLPTQHYPG